MPGSTSIVPVTILRQLRRVRRRWNTRELVRAALLLATTSGILGALLVLAALGTAPRRFVALATLLAVAWLASAVGIGLATRGRWLPPRTAHRQVDRHARLGGRLAAIVDLGPRDESALRPLLVAESAAILPLWDARRLVPRRTPAGPLAAAIASAIALAAAVALAPLLLPPPGPTVVVRDADAPRLPLRRGGDPLRRGGAIAETPSRGPADESDDSLLTDAAEALQYRLHRELWGEAEAIRAEEQARAEERETPPDAARADARGGGDERDGESTGRVEPGEESQNPEGAGTEVAAGGGAPEAGSAEAGGDSARGGGTADGPAHGAGTSTSPDLYGAPTGGIHRAAAPFTLGLTANVHMTGGAPRPPTGDTPAQMPDASPALADGSADAVGLPRAPIPPEYAAVVRRLFEREP